MIIKFAIPTHRNDHILIIRLINQICENSLNLDWFSAGEILLANRRYDKKKLFDVRNSRVDIGLFTKIN